MTKKCSAYLIGIFLVFQVSLSGQGNSLFTQDSVHEIRLNFTTQNIFPILAQNYDQNYPDVPYEIATATIDGNLVDSIGVRLKGFSSYFTSSDKKSIKLDFNEFVPGKRYDGLRKLNLNNGEGDPAMQRDVISYDLMRRAGVPAPRTGYARVFLNDEYWGLYVMVEQVDKEFLNDNFGTRDGNLFKNMQFSDLIWEGQNAAPYQNTFDLKTGDETVAWDNLIELIRQINNSPDNEFKEEIEQVFDVDRYLKVLMVDVALNNWDSYIEHGRNFYMYENPNSEKFQWIPWDYNLSMGGQFSGLGGPGGPGLPNLEDCITIQNGTCPHPADDPILFIVMIIDETCCSNEWTADCDTLYQSFLPPPPEECLTIINESCPYPPTDSIFLEVISIDPFCCDVFWDEACQNIYDDLEEGNTGGGPGGPGGGVGPNFPVDMSDSEKVLINRLLEVPEYQDAYYSYWCKFLKNDFTEERIFPLIEHRGALIMDDVFAEPNNLWAYEDFLADLDAGSNYVPGLKKFISDRIPMLRMELDELTTCSVSSGNVDFQDIVINEFCASCDSLSNIADANGEWDDWIELYNTTDETIDLSNAYISDNADEPTKWAFPLESKIDPNSYMIVWADKDDGQDGLHANFKLDKDGEFIMLTVDDTVMDSISYGEQITNLTMARRPNGVGAFEQTDKVTFGFDNDDLSSVENFELIEVKIWPNPVSNFLNIDICCNCFD